MLAPSSTSSSEGAADAPAGWRFPWGAVLAGLLVLVAERVWFGQTSVWQALERRLELAPKKLVRVELGIARDRLALAALSEESPADSGPDVARVLALGNSRALDGFQFGTPPATLRLAELLHAPISTLELRLFAREAVRHRADLLVMMLSEFDTHRPVRLVPRAGFADLRATGAIALACLTSRPGWTPGFLREKRVGLERLALAAVSDAYRYRDVLERAWLDEHLGFQPDADGRLPRLVSRELEVPEPVEDVADLQAVRARFGSLRDSFPDGYVSLLRGIRPGAHAQANESLVEEAVAILRAADCEVLFVEGPLHPAAYSLYDRAATRPEFLAFLQRLEREHGVHVLRLEQSGPYGPDDFVDPLHLRKRRGQLLGALTLERIAGILAAASPASPAR